MGNSPKHITLPSTFSDPEIKTWSTTRTGNLVNPDFSYSWYHFLIQTRSSLTLPTSCLPPAREFWIPTLLGSQQHHLITFIIAPAFPITQARHWRRQHRPYLQSVYSLGADKVLTVEKQIKVSITKRQPRSRGMDMRFFRSPRKVELSCELRWWKWRVIEIHCAEALD